MCDDRRVPLLLAECLQNVRSVEAALRVRRLALLVQWYRARELFYTGKVSRGLALARDCVHMDAVWLCGLFGAVAEEDVTRESAIALLRSSTDPRALCFAGLLSCDWSLVRASAAQGYVFALALDDGVPPMEQFQRAFRPAKQMIL